MPKRLTAPLRPGSLGASPLLSSPSRGRARSISSSFLSSPSAHSPLSSSPAHRGPTSPLSYLNAAAPERTFSTSSSRLGLKDKLFGHVSKSLRANQSSYYVYSATERVYKHCASQADYTIDEKRRKDDTLEMTAEGEEIGTSAGSVWHQELGLLPTFSTWAHVTMLHMYLLAARYRCFEPELQQAWQAGLVNHFFYQAEAKMEVAHALSSRALRQRYLKDLFVQWRGVILAYDEGVVKGDAVLAEAVWRNLFKAREDVDARKLAAVVAWMRAGLKNLAEMDDEAVQLDATAAFPELKGQFALVDVPTAVLRGELKKAEAKP
ncbi:hypothetical protein VTJ83DRAFT_1144 [Remersonia thermophila]|uniref:Ubiquinol-cytochrome c chaperone domain-containing protein n=1 Tax=Remersonia thermophila TaxID=72144 RepID=A0ABR4DND1_9PEZI